MGNKMDKVKALFEEFDGFVAQYGAPNYTKPGDESALLFLLDVENDGLLNESTNRLMARYDLSLVLEGLSQRGYTHFHDDEIVSALEGHILLVQPDSYELLVEMLKPSATCRHRAVQQYLQYEADCMAAGSDGALGFGRVVLENLLLLMNC